MNDIVGFYQVREIDDSGKKDKEKVTYCLIEEDMDYTKPGFIYKAHYIRDYQRAKEELLRFYNNGSYKSVEDMEKDSKHFEVGLETEELKKYLHDRYKIDVSSIDHFYDIEEEKLDTAVLKDMDDLLGKSESRLRIFGQAVLKAVNKLWNGPKKGLKRLGICAAALLVAGTAFSCHHNSKTGIATAVEDSTNKDDEKTTVDDTTYGDENDAPLEFNDFLELTDENTKEYMMSFGVQLNAFNQIGSGYVDEKNNHSLGMTTDQMTAFYMALLGNDFGNYVKNMTEKPKVDDVYRNFKLANGKMTHMAVVLDQEEPYFWYDKFMDNGISTFANIYDEMNSECNLAKTDVSRKEKANSFLKTIREDFGMNKDGYDPEKLLREDSKYLAVMPTVRAMYEKTKDAGLTNSISQEEMDTLMQAYSKVVKENIALATSSITIDTEKEGPTYDEFMKELEKEQIHLGYYNEDQDAKDSIRGSKIYEESINLLPKEEKKEPIKMIPNEKKEEPQEAVSSLETPSPTPVVSSSSPSTGASDSGSGSNSLTSESSVPVQDYDQTNDNFEYENSDTTKNEETGKDDSTSKDDNVTDATIKDEEASNDSKDDSKDEASNLQETIDSTNDSINQGNIVEVPSDWTIDSTHTENGSFDGSVENITTDATGEQAPLGETKQQETVTDIKDSSIGSTIIESEESYSAPVEEEQTSQEEATVETVPVEQVAEEAVNAMESGQDATIVYQTDSNSYTVETTTPVVDTTNEKTL